MCSGSEAGSYVRLMDCLYLSTPGSRVMEKKKKVSVNSRPGSNQEEEKKRRRGTSEDGRAEPAPPRAEARAKAEV